MHVVATAGHVDHGKSTLIQALTGMQPDRWADERRRGLTIDLGFAWTDLPSGATAAFVDVPGHERFVPNMLAGIGPVPAALFVVAADEGWMPQSAEHLAALDALNVRHAVLVITRSDIADPAPATTQARAELAGTSVGEVEAVAVAVAVSAPTHQGLDRLAAALDRLLARLPTPDVDAPVRLWIDRSFSIKGSGSVVTGTLTAGRLRVGDELDIAGSARRAVVKGLQSLGRPVDDAAAVARVAVNLRGVPAHELTRGDALLSPGRFHLTDLVDVRVHGDPSDALPRTIMLHLGAAAVPARVRPLGADTARLRLSRPLALHIGDRGLLRDPGRHHVSGGVTLLDVSPPPLTRRGAAAARAEVLDTLDGRPDEDSELRRRRLVRRSELEQMGIVVTRRPVSADWVADDVFWSNLRDRLPRVVDEWRAAHPLEAGPPVDVARQTLGLPERALVHSLVEALTDADAGGGASLTTSDGRVVRTRDVADLPPHIAEALKQLQTDLRARPFDAPDRDRLDTLGLGAAELAAAERAGALVRLAPGVVLLPHSLTQAAAELAALPQPFTVAQARTALATTRRVAVPLLERLDHDGLTRRLPDDRRHVCGPD